jgi:Cro/C1-type HTH DNA-binding domain
MQDGNVIMEERTITVRIRLRVREVAETRGIDLAGLVLATGLPHSKVQELWNHPTHDQDIATMVVIARALGATLDELVEYCNEGGLPGPIQQERTDKNLDKRKERA